jgi:hypothetical protein
MVEIIVAVLDWPTFTAGGFLTRPYGEPDCIK